MYRASHAHSLKSFYLVLFAIQCHSRKYMNNILYCSVKSTYVFVAVFILALHSTDSGYFLTPDHTTTTMPSTNKNLHNNNLSTLATCTDGSAFSNFGVYQQTPVRLSEFSIHTLVPDPIIAEPYRKVLIVRLFCYYITIFIRFPFR